MNSQAQHSIVIAGGMNPSIHHALWYQASDLLTEAEAEAALSDPQLLVSPHVARFVAANMEIFCRREQWQISTSDLALKERILGVAQRTFELLDQTHISGFGMNYNLVQDIEHLSLDALSGFLKGISFVVPLESCAPTFEQITVSYPMPPLEMEPEGVVVRRFHTTLFVSGEPKVTAHVAINVHHEIRMGRMDRPQKFNLSPILEKAAEVFSIAADHALAIVQQIGGK